MNTTHLKFSKEHKIIKEVIIEGGKIALKWFNNKPNVWKKEDGTDVSEADIEIDNFLQVELKKNKCFLCPFVPWPKLSRARLSPNGPGPYGQGHGTTGP